MQVSGAQAPRSWIDERILKVAKEGIDWELMRVRGHSGVKGNEQADRRAGTAAVAGQMMLEPSIATPAGIRQAYPLFFSFLFFKKKILSTHMRPRWWDNDEPGMPLHNGTAPQVGQRNHERVATSGRQSPRPILRMRGGTECRTPNGLWVRRRKEKMMGGHLVRLGLLHGGHGISTIAGLKGEGGRQ